MKTSASITPSLFEIVRPLSITEPDVDALRQGLSENAFVAFYQPQLSLKKGTIVGLEVLARWKHPQQGMLTPAYFLQALERHDLLDELFLRLFEQGLVLRARLASQNLALKMSFNLHPSQLSNPILNQAIKVLLRAHQCPADAITFEVTEAGSLDLCGTTMDNLLQLRRLGCGLSMDDFGTGFSSLERLCDLPFTELKLDASFVRKLGTHSACTAIIAHTVSLAESLGLSLVIEGVEHPAQLKKLSEMGCTLVQGYAIAPPMADTSMLACILEHLAGSRMILKSV